MERKGDIMCTLPKHHCEFCEPQKPLLAFPKIKHRCDRCGIITTNWRGFNFDLNLLCESCGDDWSTVFRKFTNNGRILSPHVVWLNHFTKFVLNKKTFIFR